MSDIDQSVTLAALVAERSSRAQLFERLHLDYCCGGSQSLAEACSPVDPVRRAHHLVVRPAPAVGTLPVAILGDELAPALGADRAAAQEAELRGSAVGTAPWAAEAAAGGTSLPAPRPAQRGAL